MSLSKVAPGLMQETSSRLAINPSNAYPNGVSIGGPILFLNIVVGVNIENSGTSLAYQMVIENPESMLQLRRRSTDQAKKAVFLELFQENVPGTAWPSIRFHHSNTFWHRIEGQTSGIYFKTGNINADDLVRIYALGLQADELTIGGFTVGASEMRILKRLAAGELEFDLYNTYQQEYTYAADWDPWDKDRRKVISWRVKNQPVTQGRWRIRFPT